MTMDKFETLVAESSIAVAILANADATDIEMLPVQPRSYALEKAQELARLWAPRGLRFIGMAGIADGKPRTALAVPLDDLRISALSQAFIAYIEVLLKDEIETRQAVGDEVEWLRSLWSLPDSRPN